MELYKKAHKELNICNHKKIQGPLREREQRSTTKKDKNKRTPINQTSQRRNSTPQLTLSIAAKSSVHILLIDRKRNKESQSSYLRTISKMKVLPSQ
jgi:hypothetical protein